MATLINGNGNPAIYAQQDADLYNGIMGPRTRILNVGSKMAATIEDANTIAIADGVIITKEGRRVQVDVGNVDEFIIPTGQAGTTRYYIIGYHLYTDGSANQLCETFVQLMASGSETITEDEFREGATEVYVSLYRIEQTGLTLNDPEALLTVGDSVSQIEDDIDDIEGDITQINSDLTELTKTHTQDVSVIFSNSYIGYGDYTPDTIDGYTCVGLQEVSNPLPQTYYIGSMTKTQIMLISRSATAVSTTITAKVTLLYIKTSLLGV